MADRDILHDLATHRERAGLEPLSDPGVIQGDLNPRYVPPPPDPNIPPDWLDPELDSEEVPRETPVASPLIPRGLGPRTAAPSPAPIECSLLVGDRAAAWKGRAVLLTEPEEASIRAIVLRAIQREVLADLEAVGGLRRPRRASVKKSAPAPAPEAPAPKRRGRPRKVPK